MSEGLKEFIKLHPEAFEGFERRKREHLEREQRSDAMKCKKSGMYDHWINRKYWGRKRWCRGDEMGERLNDTVEYKFIPESEYPEPPVEEGWYMVRLKGTVCDPDHTLYPRVVRYIKDETVYASEDGAEGTHSRCGRVGSYDIIDRMRFEAN